MVLAEYANHETTSFIAQLISMSCVIWVCYNIVFGIKNPDKCKPALSDNFQLGYVRDDEPSQTFRGAVEEDELEALKREVEIAKLKKQLVELKARQVHAPNSKNKPKDQSDVNPILQDCIDALIALGVPKRKAKAEADNILENSNIKTVQDFITEYGKR